MTASRDCRRQVAVICILPARAAGKDCPICIAAHSQEIPGAQPAGKVKSAGALWRYLRLCIHLELFAGYGKQDAYKLLVSI